MYLRITIIYLYILILTISLPINNSIITLIRYFLSVIHHRKSTTLEWMIIVLITGEMLIGICSLALQLYKSNSDDDDDDDDDDDSGDRRRHSSNSSGSRRRKDEDVHDE